MPIENPGNHIEAGAAETPGDKLIENLDTINNIKRPRDGSGKKISEAYGENPEFNKSITKKPLQVFIDYAEKLSAQITADEHPKYPGVQKKLQEKAEAINKDLFELIRIAQEKDRLRDLNVNGIDAILTEFFRKRLYEFVITIESRTETRASEIYEEIHKEQPDITLEKIEKNQKEAIHIKEIDRVIAGVITTLENNLIHTKPPRYNQFFAKMIMENNDLAGIESELTAPNVLGKYGKIFDHNNFNVPEYLAEK